MTNEEMMHIITVRNQIFNNVEGAVLEMYEWDKEKALKAFCYANCTEITKKKCECENPCKEYFIFERKMEE